MRLIGKVLVFILAATGLLYFFMLAWGWFVTGGFSSTRGSYSERTGRRAYTVLTLSVSPDFVKVAEHKKQLCESGVEEHFCRLSSFDAQGSRDAKMTIIASNTVDSINPLPVPVLPIRLHWKSENELWLQHGWTMGFYVDSLSGVDVEVSKYLP